MQFKPLSARIISIALIIFSLYQTFLSLNSIFFIYPQLNPGGQDSQLIQTGLVEKAFLIYLSMIASGVYGAFLLFRPKEEVKFIQIISGVLIFLISFFFVVKTPFTTDPIFNFLKDFFTQELTTK